MMPLIKVNLLKLNPLLSNHIVPALVAPIPQFHILLSLGLIRENAELGLARNQGKGVIRILHYHLTERWSCPLGALNFQVLLVFHSLSPTTLRVFLMNGRLENRICTHKAHTASRQRLLHNPVLSLLLNVEVDLSVVHKVCKDWQLCMHDHILNVFPFKNRNFVNLPLPFAFLSL